jgi:hypothetical protein
MRVVCLTIIDPVITVLQEFVTVFKTILSWVSTLISTFVSTVQNVCGWVQQQQQTFQNRCNNVCNNVCNDLPWPLSAICGVVCSTVCTVVEVIITVTNWICQLVTVLVQVFQTIWTLIATVVSFLVAILVEIITYILKIVCFIVQFIGQLIGVLFCALTNCIQAGGVGPKAHVKLHPVVILTPRDATTNNYDPNPNISTAWQTNWTPSHLKQIETVANNILSNQNVNVCIQIAGADGRSAIPSIQPNEYPTLGYNLLECKFSIDGVTGLDGYAGATVYLNNNMNQTPGDLTMFLIDSFSQSGNKIGCMTPPSHYVVVAYSGSTTVGSGSIPRINTDAHTMVHEVGHAADLWHVSSTDDIMYASGNDSAVRFDLFQSCMYYYSQFTHFYYSCPTPLLRGEVLNSISSAATTSSFNPGRTRNQILLSLNISNTVDNNNNNNNNNRFNANSNAVYGALLKAVADDSTLIKDYNSNNPELAINPQSQPEVELFNATFLDSWITTNPIGQQYLFTASQID